MTIDDPATNDNRNYDYTHHRETERFEYPVIASMVTDGARVLDLGCGNGALLERLIAERGAQGVGMEISPSGVSVCQQKGLQVRSGRIDEVLPYDSDSFDFAICNVTIHMVMFPEVLLREMKRVARYQIVSLPNFGFWRNRWDLAVHGRMPRPMLFGYSWYTTGHIHQLSFTDLEQLIEDVGGLTILQKEYDRPADPVRRTIAAMAPTWFHLLGIYLLEKRH